MHDLAGLTNLKSASGLGISGYSATRKTRKECESRGVKTQREREREEREGMCDGERWWKRNCDAVEADAVLAVLCL